jgi:uncharacterized membrane protein YidH (DUF202 family)
MVNEPAPTRRLKGWLPMALGVLALAVGALWTLQGLDILTDSRMSGKETWTIIGAVLAVTGLILIVVGVNVRSRSKRELPQDGESR